MYRHRRTLLLRRRWRLWRFPQRRALRDELGGGPAFPPGEGQGVPAILSDSHRTGAPRSGSEAEEFGAPGRVLAPARI
jgi:hypothetical protein